MEYDPVMRIEIYSHFFKILNPNPNVVRVLLMFSRRFAVCKDVGVKSNNRYVKENNQPQFTVFAYRTPDNSEFRFHIGQYDEFIQYMHFNHIQPHLYKVSYVGMYEPAKIDVTMNPSYELRDYQKEIVDFVSEEAVDGNRSRLIALGTGLGKAQNLDAMIKIPGSWKRMGDMQVGDDIIAADGTTAKVTGVFPQGIKDMYRIHFSDGRSTECCAEHLWNVYYYGFKDGYKTMDTTEIIRRLNTVQAPSKFYVQLTMSEKNPDIDLPLDPYILGLFLGDGCVSSPSDVRITTPDDYILDEIREKLPAHLRLKFYGGYDWGVTRKNRSEGMNDYIYIFRELNLTGKRCYDKFIPDIYFDGSTKQRLALVQGLLDTDGTATKEGNVSFCTTSLDLALGLQYLIRSLGGLARICDKSPYFRVNGERRKGRPAYTVYIRYKTPSHLFRLPKKKDRTNDDNRCADTLKLRIEHVEYVGKKEAQCISIDHPDHLYVTDQFIVTHNTLSSLASIGTIKTRTMIAILPTYIDQWAKEITKILNVKPKDIMIVKGSAQMEGLIGLGQDNALKAKFIIISIPTMRNFFKNFEYNVNDYKSEDICKILGVGTVIVDETHQHLHAVYNLLLHTHVPRVIGLSATLLSDDAIIKKVQHCMFPKEIRFDKVKLDQYIKVYAIAYRFLNFYKANLRTSERGSNNYSHNAFEKSILLNKEVSAKYLNFIVELIEKAYNKDYVKGDKLLIFASSIAMCTAITKHVRKEFPDFTVERFVEDDPYENMLKPDIRVSTILSCGTGKDIPNLRATIMTTSVSSTVSNIQALGRLRKLPDRDVKFYYVFCEQIPKHCQYHSSKKQLFQDRVASIKELKYPYGL